MVATSGCRFQLKAEAGSRNTVDSSKAHLLLSPEHVRRCGCPTVRQTVGESHRHRRRTENTSMLIHHDESWYGLEPVSRASVAPFATSRNIGFAPPIRSFGCSADLSPRRGRAGAGWLGSRPQHAFEDEAVESHGRPNLFLRAAVGEAAPQCTTTHRRRTDGYRLGTVLERLPRSRMPDGHDRVFVPTHSMRAEASVQRRRDRGRSRHGLPRPVPRSESIPVCTAFADVRVANRMEFRRVVAKLPQLR